MAAEVVPSAARGMLRGRCQAASNHLDFLLVLDEYTRAHSSGSVTVGYDLHAIAHQAGLVAWGDRVASRWTGQLVDLGYLVHGPLGAGNRRAVPPPFMWGDDVADRFGDYRVTGTGREEADRMRRLARERRTDAALGHALPRLGRPWMTATQVQAVADRCAVCRPPWTPTTTAEPSARPRTSSRRRARSPSSTPPHRRRRGTPNYRRCSSPQYLKPPAPRTSARVSPRPCSGSPSCNVAGAGHGHAALPETSGAAARLAASAATGIADFILVGNPQ
jgi:hypothetical protein